MSVRSYVCDCRNKIKLFTNIYIYIYIYIYIFLCIFVLLWKYFCKCIGLCKGIHFLCVYVRIFLSSWLHLGNYLQIKKKVSFRALWIGTGAIKRHVRQYYQKLFGKNSGASLRKCVSIRLKKKRKRKKTRGSVDWELRPLVDTCKLYIYLRSAFLLCCLWRVYLIFFFICRGCCVLFRDRKYYRRAAKPQRCFLDD